MPEPKKNDVKYRVIFPDGSSVETDRQVDARELADAVAGSVIRKIRYVEVIEAFQPPAPPPEAISLVEVDDGPG